MSRCVSASVDKQKENNEIRKAHNDRIDVDIHYQRWISEVGISLLKDDGGEKLRSRSRHGSSLSSTWFRQRLGLAPCFDPIDVSKSDFAVVP